MKQKQHILVGNWKMNPSSYESASKLFKGTVKRAMKSNKVTTIICPPSLYIGRLGKTSTRKVFLGAQDVFYEEKGSYTGCISVPMLFDAGVSHVIVGHSECRKRGDTNEIVNKKMHAVLEAGLTAIVCVGEEIRNDAGEHLAFLKTQLTETLKGVNKKHAGKLILAYEPVWAIGAREAMAPQDVHETSLFIQKTITEILRGVPMNSFPLLYGGSVDAINARAIVQEGEVAGLLVGRQSLDVDTFGQIIDLLSF